MGQGGGRGLGPRGAVGGEVSVFVLVVMYGNQCFCGSKECVHCRGLWPSCIVNAHCRHMASLHVSLQHVKTVHSPQRTAVWGLHLSSKRECCSPRTVRIPVKSTLACLANQSSRWHASITCITTLGTRDLRSLFSNHHGSVAPDCMFQTRTSLLSYSLHLC